MQSFVDAFIAATDEFAERLPKKFPARVYDTIRAGVRGQARKFDDSKLAAKGK